MSIQLPILPYSLDALEPQISREALEVHYKKHHQNYVDTLNELIRGTSLEDKSLEEIMFLSFERKQKIHNNACQVWNHTFFWNCLIPSGHEPSKNLTEVIEENFGTVEDLKNEFATAAKALFGSGWVWLVKDKWGKLKVRSLGNAGNPLVDLGEIPLLTCDVWEHAYYLDYKNERAKFLENFWEIVNWEFVEDNLKKENRRMAPQIFQPKSRASVPNEYRM